MRFTKMHGLGNDYVYVDGFAETLPDTDPGLADLAQRVADRHVGIGGDGLIVVVPAAAPDAHVRMRMFNADGSESEMCGNGIRCVCKLVHDHRLGPDPDADPLRVETGAGVLSLRSTRDEAGRVDAVAVDMGRPELDPARVPVDEAKLDDRLAGFHYVSMGNPHAVCFVDDDAPLARPQRGAELEVHPAFPNRINVHFVRVRDRATVDVYHWERGSGATLACGTGACAVAVAGVRAGLLDRSVTAHLPGGPLQLDWPADDATVTMTGPAVEVFRGVWPD